MTVCVAAMGSGIIFGASDRMLTVGDVQFEPDAEKTFPITNSIVMMFAGDAAFHREIAERVRIEAIRQVREFPDEWLTVKYIVDLYVGYRNTLKGEMAEAALLAPLGLTRSTFLAAHSTLHADFARELASNIINFPVPSVSCLVVGIDEAGPDAARTAHIYSIDDGRVTCHNAAGFAAIGTGHWHAESELMAAGHSPEKEVAETAAIVYRAKRRAETAPGVGEGTDMFVISGLGKHSHLRQEVHQKLDALYDDYRRAEAKAKAKTIKELESYVTSLNKPTIQVDQGSGNFSEADEGAAT